MHVVQVERHKQRLGVAEHYDFVYLCVIRGVRPELRSSINPRWMSLAGLRAVAREQGIERAPFPDVVPTVEKLIPIVRGSAATR